MDDVWSRAFEHAIDGDWTHPNPSGVLDGVSASDAGKVADGLPNSIYQQAMHLLAWADWGLCKLRGVPFEQTREQEEANFFPSNAAPQDDAEWQRVLDRMKALGPEFDRLLPSVDPGMMLPAPSDFSHARVAIFVVAHSAYHTAYIVAMRRLLGIWNPER
ncbi:MAG: hypothetical protein FJY67_07895 [Calditrichaeota bacterium]|nr:hypothetical protein [Calditrichota bacterium]